MMCENTLTTAASQKMLVLLEDVFQVSIVANVRRALFVCSRCEVNVHFIEGAMKLKKEMEEHLLETLDIAQSEGGGSAGLPRPKRRRHDSGDGVDAGAGQGLPSGDRFNNSEGGREFGSEAAAHVFAVKRSVAGGGEGEAGVYHHSNAGFDPMRPVSYAMKRPRPLPSDMPGRAPGLPPLGLVRGPGPGGAGAPPDGGNDLHGSRPMGNGRLLLPHEPVGVAEHGGGGGSAAGAGRVYDVDRSMAAALHSHHASEQLQQMPGMPGMRRRRGYPCAQCGKVLRTRAWLTRHLQTCGTDSPFNDDMEGVLSDQDSYSEDDADATVDSKGGDLSSLVVDTSTPVAISTPPSNVCACKDCGKTFKRKTWLLKHAMQCVASRVGSSSTPTGHLGSGMAGPNQVGSALTCGHCGKRYLGRYDKYREHVKQCGLRANGGGIVGAGLGGVGLGGASSAAPGSGGAAGGVGAGGGGGGVENACPKCGESVAGGSDELERHVAECAGQAGAENTVHTCPTCGRCYAKRYDYFLRHVRSCQRGDDRGGVGMGGVGGVDQQALADGEPCVCPRCSKMYRRADHLWQHMEMCRGIPGRNVGPHVCDKCGKTYGTRYDVLQRHVLTCKGVALGAQGAAVEPLLDTTQAAAQRSILGAVATGKEGGIGGGGGNGDGSTLAERSDGDGLAVGGGGGRLSMLGADDASGGVPSTVRTLAEGGGGGGALDVANGRARVLAGPTPNECPKCGKVYTLRYDHFVRHVSKCHGLPTGASPDVDSYMCQKCGRDFGREYELYLRHVDACDGADDDDDDGGADDDDGEGSQHVCPCCGKACATYEELWTHAQTCQSRRGAMLEGDESASAAGQDDDGGSGDVGGMRASGKMRNMCAKCGKCYVLLTCYRKHVAKCMGGGGDAAAAAATNGGLFNGGMRRPGDVYGASSGSPSTGSNPADDIENEDEDAIAGGGGVDATSPYECDNCGLSFGARRSSFLKHVALCTGSAGGGPAGYPGAGGASSLHVCNYCGKHFVRLGNYTRHVQMCQYAAAAAAGGGAEVLRQLHIKQCDRCLEAVPADQYVSHIERCYAARAASSLLLLQQQQPEGGQLQALGGGGEGFAVSASPASVLLAAQHRAVPAPAWTCPRCKKEFQQSGHYIRHISTCSMEFLKCPKCDFGRYYSDSKDFDNHVIACRGKAGAVLPPGAAGPAAPSLLSSSSPLPVPSMDKPGSGPVAASDPEAGALAEGHPAADHRQLIPSDPAQSLTAAYNPQPYLPGEQYSAAAAVAVPSSTMTEAMECADHSANSDPQDDLQADPAEFALQEEVVAAADGEAAATTLLVGGSAEGPTASCDGGVMLA